MNKAITTVEDIYPLSPMQAGMLFHALYDDTSQVHFVQLTWRIKGNLNVPVFQRAWQKVIERYSILRTSFSFKGLEKPMQVVRRSVESPWAVHDWTKLGDNEQAQELQQYLEADRKQGFDLSVAPLMRLHLIETSKGSHYFVCSFHHLLLDGWSFSIVIKEVLTLYSQLSSGGEAHLGRPPAYKDYIAWLSKQDFSRAQEFWRESLKGFYAPTPVKVRRENSNGIQTAQDYRILSSDISAELTGNLQVVARQHQLTLNTLIHAAWALLLAHYSGENDIVFGATLAGRPAELAGVESMVGLFVNTLPVRVHIPSDALLLDWLKKIQREQFKARSYEYSQLAEVQRCSDIIAGTPLFETILVFENYPVDKALNEGLGNSGLSIEPVGWAEQTSFPLTVAVYPGPQLRIKAAYDQQLYPTQAVERMLGHMQTLLKEITTGVRKRLRDLSPISDQEKEQIVEKWNQTSAEFPRNKCIHELFEEQVRRTPQALALEYEKRQLTYEQLDQKASQLAHRLQQLGVGPDKLVCICVKRSLEMIVGLMGILKAGGVYVPIDPECPPERMAFMLEDTQATVLLTQESLLSHLPPYTGAIICLDRELPQSDGSVQFSIPRKPKSENLAYVIYTSGSTGKPKGVQVRHAGLCNTISTAGKIFGVDSSSRVAQVASFTFDASVAEIFFALTTGASLHLLNASTLLTASEFRNHLLDRQITFIGLSPSLLNVLETDEFPHLRTIGVGGETCSLQTAAKWSRGRKFLNAYAPTESTIFSTIFECSEKYDEVVPVGRPIANTQVYILDREMRPVAVGIPGELHIAGAGLARGYLNLPELTAERFIANPFVSRGGERMYRTGDLARWQADGNIEFLGRVDHQVKIRGFRIELGEIETVLEQHEDVAQAVAVVREDVPGDKRLVGYVSLKQTNCITERELKAHLSTKLPEYMVPGAIVELETFPLTNNGKIDRKALPAPDLRRNSTEENYVAPRTPTEEMLVMIWAEVLGLQRVGIFDNFFELGGHSLFATQIISRVHQAWNISLPLKNLFEDPTIAGLGGAIDQYGKDKEMCVAPILPSGRDGELPLSFAQQRLWFLEQLEDGNSGYNLTTAVRLNGTLNLAALENSLARLMRRHEALRTIFPAIEGRAVQVIQEHADVNLELIDLRQTEDSHERMYGLLRENARAPFDLSRGPLWRALLLSLSDQDHVLQLTLHHIISDGWSMQVLVREMSILYGAFVQGHEPRLDDLNIQYADFAAWQREWLQGEVLERQLKYWRDQLADSKVPQLPTDYSRGKVLGQKGATEARVISRELKEELIKLSRQENLTLFMVLLGAFQVLAWRYTGEKDLVVGTPIANRNRQEIENLIGFFVNTLVMRTKLNPEENFRQLLKLVRETSLAAYAHQDLPFEKLVDELQPERELARTPLFQVMFVHQNTPPLQVALNGLTLTPVDYASDAAQFDLMLVVAESGNGLQLTAQYKTDLFAGPTIQRLLAHYEFLLHGLAANLKQSIHSVPYFSQTERTQLLQEWNQTLQPVRQDGCIQQLFEEQVARTPNAIAVRYKGNQWTYEELNQRANQLAHYLRRRGITTEIPVGICLERSLDIVVGLIAVLKAGGAYVPLDPNYPPERLEYTLQDSGARVLLAQKSLARLLPAYSGIVVEVDTQWNEISNESRENPARGNLPEDVAYVIYTSGSTGRPKGVAIRHSSAVVMLRWAHHVFSRSELGEVLASTSICFDLSVFEIFVPLTCGGAVSVAANALELPAMPEAKLLTLINTVPSAMRELVRSQAIPESVRVVNLAGEALRADLVRDVYATTRVERVFNLYGPTEDTTYSAYAWVKRNSLTVPIGKPIANTQAYVLDEWLQPVATGIVGSLYLAGDGLARGYLNNPERTAERFVANPFSSKAGERMYETGDLVRWAPDGTLEFLGRRDNQIKLRGFRIELGEIEAFLGKHEHVQQCAVAVRERKSGEKQLVAFVVAKTGQECRPDDLRCYLKKRLPEHMVPALFVGLEQLPLTPNGKIDHKALIVPERVDAYSEASAGVPQTQEEVTLAQIWAQVLGLEQVGTHENFFQLGGDSILSIQIVARANRAGLQITPRQIFENQTVAELARVARRTAIVQAEQGLVSGPVPLTPVQHWFFEQKLYSPHHFNQAVMLVARRALDTVALEKVVTGLIQHHDALRMRFSRNSEGQFHQHNALQEHNQQIVLKVDLSQLSPDRRIAELERLAGEWQASLNLEDGPLVRFVLFDLGIDDPQRLLIVIHHLVVDGVSWRILLEDLENSYRELQRTEAPQFSRKTTSFQQWSRWLQEQYAQAERITGEIGYWQEVLAEHAPLPIDFAKGANTVESTDAIKFLLNESQTQALVQSSARAYRMQVQEILLTALLCALNGWTGKKSLLLNMEGHGREEISDQFDVTRTVGWFTTIFPLRLESNGNGDLGRLFKYVKEQVRNVPQRGLSYGLLRYLHHDEQIREALRPLAPIEISFNYLGQMDQILDREGIFGAAAESGGLVQSPGQKRAHILDITASIQQRQLQIQLFYSRNLHQRETLQLLGENLLRQLDRLTAHCESVSAPQYTPSDFPWVKLDQGSLEEVLHGGREIEQIYPLTPMQEGMLFHTLAAEKAGVYLEQLTSILEGELDVDAFARAWQKAVDHHEILRSRFAWGLADQIVRVVEKKTLIQLQQHDWQGLPHQEREQALDQYLKDDLARGFDVAQAPLMRLALIHVDQRKYWLVWNFHHLLLDGWSLPIVLKDVFAGYRALCDGEEPRLDRPGAYQDYAAWLRRQDLRKAEEFWRERMKGFFSPVRLGVENSGPKTELGPANEDLYLSEEVSQKLEDLARSHHLTLNTLVQGMWALLMGRYSGASEVVFGATISGRPGEVEGIERLVGVFINTLPVRVSVDEDEELIPWLHRIQQHQVEQRQYEYTSLADIQRWSEFPRGTPLFSTIVVFENTPAETAFQEEMKGRSLRAASLFRREQTNYPIEIMATPGKKFSLRMIYARNEYDPGIASQILRHLCDLLEGIAENGNVPLSRLAFSSRLELPPLVRRSQDAVPLSHHQERLWFIDRFETGAVYESSPVYHNIPLALLLQGPVDRGFLEDAINQVIARHDALQIRVLDQDGQALQIKNDCSVSLKVVDVQNDGKSVSHERAVQWITAESRIPFSLSLGQVVRATLFRCNSVESLLVIVVHHIAADRTSLKIIAAELSEIYQARVQARAPVLDQCEYDYLDYAGWQHAVPEHAWTPAWLYWKQQLGGDRANLEIPIKRPRHAIHVFESAAHEFSISSDVVESMRSPGQITDTGDMQFLLTAFYALLLIYSGQKGFFIGLMAKGRTQSGAESLVGPLSNLLAFRCKSIGRTFSELLSSVSENFEKAIQYHQMPFELVTQQLKLPKDMSRTVLFDVLFDYDAETSSALSFGDARAQVIETNLGYGKYDLNLYIRPGSTGLSATIIFNEKLYDRNVIQRMAHHYQVLLRAIISKPEQGIPGVQLLNEDEKKQQLVVWNSTQAEYPRSATIHGLFEEQVALDPQKLAIKYRNARLSYLELNQRANQLAHHLRTQGVVPGMLVGICLNRSVEMVVTIMAVLKAGGGYLPLDPSYPEDRLAFMLEDGRVSHLVTTESLLEKFAGRNIPWTTAIDRDRQIIDKQSHENPVHFATPGDLAYCIYTSGSTGQPNGVLVEHVNVVRLLKNEKFQFSFSEHDVWSLFHSYAFDFSVWEIFGALAYGGAIVLVPSDLTRDSHAFLDLLCQEKVTVLSQTPAAFYNLAAHATEAYRPDLALRYVVFGGEALQPAHLKTWSQLYPAVKLINMYGITETTVHVTFREITHTDIDENTSNIGVPIPTLRTYVMGPSMELLPVGVIGELYAGGDGVTRGYMNRPQLTATRFVPDPFSAVPGSRLYRSGDLARYREDGSLEYMGRVDHQVKIRGFRIELGEIETALRAHPSVEQVLVLARSGAGGEKQLVAYLVISPEQTVTQNELRIYLREVLPDYMVPSFFVYLERFPLTGNGKVDRKALPEPHIGGEESQRAYAPPRTPTEEMLCEIWADVLKVDRVGIHQSFFDLGGHSLLAMQLISRIRKVCQSELELRRLFENPTVAGLAALVSEQQTGEMLPAIEIARRDAPMPLSFAQQRLWFLEQLDPGNNAFCMATGLRLEGTLDTAALEKSLVEIVKRHEALRTRFIERNGEAFQEILPALDSTEWFEIRDLRHLGEAAQAEAETLAQAAVGIPFDLRNGPLLRVKLLQLGSEDHVLQLTMHHIIGDGWSMGVLVREFAALYQACRRDQASPLPELKVQYADYALWQRNWMQGERLQHELQYWADRLSGIPRLEFLTDRARRMIEQSAGGFVGCELPPGIGAGLKRIARDENATLFMVLLATLQVLLWRYTRQQEMAVGTPVANRKREEIEGLIGFFVNTLVLRGSVDSEESFRSLLKRVKETVLGAYAHQDLPFERIVEELQPARDLSQTPLFQVMLVLQNAPVEELTLQGLKVTPQGTMPRGAQYDLTVEVDERSIGQLRLGLHYRRELYEVETAQRILGHFQQLLEDVVSNTGQRLSELQLMPEEEKQQLLKGWNSTEAEYPQEKSIPELFEQQAARRPEAEAVRFGSTALTYAELNRRANQLARRLQHLAVRPEALVGICVERSLEMMVGLLAVLKAGGAYVPLDPAYPQERLDFMMSDARVKVLLTQERLLTRLPGHQAQVICLDRDWPEVEKFKGSNPGVNTTADNLAYVIYTSGSTGRPKAALNLHRGICNLVQEHRRLFGAGDGKTVLQFSSLSFDAATWDWTMALLNGARLVLPSRHEMLSGPMLWQLLHDEHVSIVTLPPSVLEMLPDGQPLPDLETIVVAGEACSQHLAARWGRKHHRMHNAYGPSETTVCATVSTPVQGGEAPDIGSPIANANVYILDERMEPTPVGVPGELYIGGVMLGRGYLNRPDLTAERFVANPFGSTGRERLYRTGDRARWKSDATIEFLGRLDCQVKLRGFRIELEEIEAVLREYRGVEQAVVIAREDRPGEKRIVAYVVGLADVPDLKAYAGKKLPDYMVPSAIVSLPHLPLTPNGKIDRRALPAPDMNSLSGRPEYVAPRTGTEEIVTKIWADVLGVERVGLADNFFELGGHSLLATQVLSRIRQACNTEIPLRSLFEDPTVARLAQKIDEHRSCNNMTTLAAMVPVPRGGDLPLSFAQQRIWFLEQLNPGSKAFHVPLTVRLKGDLSISHLQESFNHIVKRHEPFRTVFAAVNGEPVQRIRAAQEFPLQMIDLQGVQANRREKRIQELLLDHLRQNFDLGNGPLARGLLLRLGPEDYLLHLVMHHIVSDGWSMGVFVRELEALYNAFSAGKSPVLQELGIQYADFASWQRQWMSSGILRQQLDYWKKQLSGMEVTAIPSDKPRPVVSRHQGATESLVVKKQIQQGLKQLAGEQNATLFMVILAALQVVLHSRSGSLDVSVGTDIANRNRSEIEPLIGFFVNTLVLRTSLAGDPSFRSLTARVRETTLGAYSNQDLPFDRLVEELRPHRDKGHSPLFRIKISLGNMPAQVTGMQGLQLSLLPPTDTVAASDMIFFLAESDGGVQINLVYDMDLFQPSTAKSVLSAMEMALSVAADNPDLKLSALRRLLAERDARHASEEHEELESIAYGKFKLRSKAAAPNAVTTMRGEKK